MTMLRYLWRPFRLIFRALFCFMQAQEQAEANLGLANGRVPPTWSVEQDKRYPLRHYVQDLALWAAGTDVDINRRGPVAALRLTGAARTIIREMPPELLQLGQVVADQNGQPLQLTGLQVLVRALERRYGALDQEQQIFAVSELMGFQRWPQESTDEMIARFDVIHFRATQVAGMGFPATIRAWVILTHLRVPRGQWPLILSPTLGMLPLDDNQYDDMIAYLRRNAHLFEQRGDNSRSLVQPFYQYEGDTNAEQYDSSFTYHADPNSYDGNYNYTNSEPSYPVLSPEADDDTISWHSFSTGNSLDDQDVDWTDAPVEPEQLYFQYRGAKKRFRFYAAGRKRFHGKGRKGGKGKSKGKGKNAGKSRPHSSSGPHTTFSTDDDSTQAVCFKGRGKGGNQSNR